MERIWQPVNVGSLALANRLVMPPMKTSKAGEDGEVTEELCRYYEERSRYSKIGLIITEHCFICPQGKASLRQISIAKEEDVAGLGELAERIHAGGARVFAQLNHGGSASSPEVTGSEIVGPSRVLHPRQKEEKLPRALTGEEIHEITAQFAAAAVRAKRAGFDGVEIHSAHGYLLNQFYSPLTNHREDEYGAQSIENRVRFAVEVIRAVRNAVGEDYPLALRLGGCDYMEGGSTIEDCAAACRLLAAEKIDLLDLSGGMRAYTRPDRQEPGYFGDMSAPVCGQVPVPVLLTGGVKKLSEAEALLESGAADMIGIGRAILKNAHWAD